MNTTYHRIAADTIAAVTPLAIGQEKDNWGAPRLMRIFNFTARQVTTLYERGGIQKYTIPAPTTYGSDKAGYSAAVTSSMEIHNFHDLPNPDEIRQMHERLVKAGGKPPALDDIMGGSIGKARKTGSLPRPKPNNA